MFSLWQFYSDTNAANFADDLHAAGVRFTTTGDSVTIPDTPDWAYTLAHSYSGEDVTTGGLMVRVQVLSSPPPVRSYSLVYFASSVERTVDDLD